MDNKVIPLGADQPNGKPNLNREQRRLVERANQEAHEMFVALTKKFYDCFMENTPDSPEVKAKEEEVKAKWKMYCTNRQLLIPAYSMVSKSIEAIKENYEKAKNDKPEA